MKDEAGFPELSLFLLNQWLNGRSGSSMKFVCRNRFGRPMSVLVSLRDKIYTAQIG